MLLDAIMLTSRRVSSGVAIIYTALAAWAGGLALALRLWLFLPFPLACIWFADAMGQYSSPMRLTRPTPGAFVAFFGWLLLLAPIALFFFWRK